LFEFVEKVERPPGHAAINTRTSGDICCVVKYPPCDFGGAVESNFGGKDAAVQFAADVHIFCNNIALDISPYAKEQTGGVDPTEDASMNLNSPSDSRHPLTVSALPRHDDGTPKRSFSSEGFVPIRRFKVSIMVAFPVHDKAPATVPFILAQINNVSQGEPF